MTITQIKEKYTCIDLLGEPSKKTKNGYLYHAPWRTDTHESLSVTPNGKGWNDLATGEHGSVIDLAMMILNTKDVKMACEYILFSFPSLLMIAGKKKKKYPLLASMLFLSHRGAYMAISIDVVLIST